MVGKRDLIRNTEIVLISSSLTEVDMMVSNLKVSEETCDLIWLRDSRRTFDYLSSMGLYKGKQFGGQARMFILGENFPEIDPILNLLQCDHRFLSYPVYQFAMNA